MMTTHLRCTTIQKEGYRTFHVSRDLFLSNQEESISKVIAKASPTRIDICLGSSSSILYFMFVQFFVFSALDLLFMLFSDVVQSIFFMNEFFAAFVAFYNWVMMGVPCMTN
jgi:hypothetical protein